MITQPMQNMPSVLSKEPPFIHFQNIGKQKLTNRTTTTSTLTMTTSTKKEDTRQKTDEHNSKTSHMTEL